MTDLINTLTDSKSTTIESIIVSSTQRRDLKTNSNTYLATEFNSNKNILGYRLNSVSFKKNYHLCDFTMLAYQNNVLVQTITIQGNYSAVEFASKLQQQLISQMTGNNMVNITVSYDSNSGKISIAGNASAFLLANPITLTIANKKSAYYIGNHMNTSQSFIFPSANTPSTWNLAGIFNGCYFPPNLYVLSNSLCQGGSVYRNNCIAVISNSKITELDNTFKWVTLDNKCTDIKYIKETFLNEVDILLAIEDLDNLNQLKILDFNYGDISADIDLI